MLMLLNDKGYNFFVMSIFFVEEFIIMVNLVGLVLFIMLFKVIYYVYLRLFLDFMIIWFRFLILFKEFVLICKCKFL